MVMTWKLCQQLFAFDVKVLILHCLDEIFFLSFNCRLVQAIVIIEVPMKPNTNLHTATRTREAFKIRCGVKSWIMYVHRVPLRRKSWESQN
jgi:hypothetical protein